MVSIASSPAGMIVIFGGLLLLYLGWYALSRYQQYPYTFPYAYLCFSAATWLLSSTILPEVILDNSYYWLLRFKLIGSILTPLLFSIFIVTYLANNDNKPARTLNIALYSLAIALVLLILLTPPSFLPQWLRRDSSNLTSSYWSQFLFIIYYSIPIIMSAILLLKAYYQRKQPRLNNHFILLLVSTSLVLLAGLLILTKSFLLSPFAIMLSLITGLLLVHYVAHIFHMTALYLTIINLFSALLSILLAFTVIKTLVTLLHQVEPLFTWLNFLLCVLVLLPVIAFLYFFPKSFSLWLQQGRWRIIEPNFYRLVELNTPLKCAEHITDMIRNITANCPVQIVIFNQNNHHYEIICDDFTISQLDTKTDAKLNMLISISDLITWHDLIFTNYSCEVRENLEL